MEHIKLDLKVKQTIFQLKQIHGNLNTVTASTVNRIAERFVNRYKNNLSKTLIIRTNYTYGAIGSYPATAIRTSGEFRSTSRIDARVFVKNYKGGLHYLAVQEFGLEKSQQASAENYVSMPTKQARKGGSFRGSVRLSLGLLRSPARTLSIKGNAKNINNFGEQEDGLGDSQRIAILHKYKKLDPFGWNLKTPFNFYIGGHTDLYQLKGNKFQLVRMLRKKKQKIKPIPNFRKTMDSFTKQEINSVFLREAKNLFSS